SPPLLTLFPYTTLFRSDPEIITITGMKTCPSCHRTYEDETLKFCLDDGAALRLANSASTDPNATQHLPSQPIAQPGPTIPSAQSTLTYRPEPRQTSPQRFATPDFRSPERTRT